MTSRRREEIEFWNDAIRAFKQASPAKVSAMITKLWKVIDLKDAAAFCETRQNACKWFHTLAGFVIEILSKPDCGKISRSSGRRRHEVQAYRNATSGIPFGEANVISEAMFEVTSEVAAGPKKQSERDGKDHLSDLKTVFAVWTIGSTLPSASAKKWLMQTRYWDGCVR